MASKFWVGGTGNLDGSTTTHISDTSGGAGGATYPASGDSLTFDASSGGGTVTFTATATLASITAGAFTGTINTNGQTVILTGSFNISGTGTRTITFGSSTITSLDFTAGTTTNLTFNSNTSTLNIGGTGVSGTSLDGGGLTYNIVNVQCSNSSQTFNGTNTFTTLTLTGTTSKVGAWAISANQTVTGTLTINGNSTTNRILVNSSAIGTSRTISAGTVTITNTDFRDITGSGAGSWNLSAITGGSGDCGGNTGITFTTPTTQHWTNASSSTWSTSSNWTSRVPLPQDDVVMDKAFGTSQTVTADMPRYGKNIDWTGATWTTALTWATTTSASFYGSMTLISGLSITGNFTTTWEGRTSCTFKSYSLDFKNSLNITGFGGTLTLQDDLTSTANNRSLTFFTGTLDANNYNISFGTISRSGTIATTLTMGSGTWLITDTTGWTSFNNANTTINANTSTIKLTNTASGGLTFTGGGKTYYNVWFARGTSTGSNTISGNNTFNQLKDDGSVAHSLIFTATSTQTFTGSTPFVVSGSAGNLITINSHTTGTHNLVVSGGAIVSCDYLNIQHSVATPASTWFAGTHSTDNQAVATAGSGWTFTGVAYTLALDQGSYTYTGQTVGLSYGRIISINQGSYTYTGQDVVFKATRYLLFDQGSYTYTGQNVGLGFGRTLAINQGSYSYTGMDVILAVTRSLIINQDSYSLSGQDTSFKKGFILNTESGLYSLVGEDVRLYSPIHWINESKTQYSGGNASNDSPSSPTTVWSNRSKSTYSGGNNSNSPAPGATTTWSNISKN